MRIRYLEKELPGGCYNQIIIYNLRHANGDFEFDFMFGHESFSGVDFLYYTGLAVDTFYSFYKISSGQCSSSSRIGKSRTAYGANEGFELR